MYNSINLSEIFKDPLTKKLSLWGFQIAGVVLLVFAPLNILDISPVLAAIARFMSGIVPSIDKWVAHSLWPQPTRLFFSYCWLTIPFQIVIISKHKQSEERFVRNWRDNLNLKYFFKLIILLLFVGCLVLFCFYFALPYAEPSTAFKAKFDVYKSKLAQAIYGVFMAFSVATVIALVIWWIKNFRFIYFNNSTQGDKR